MSCVTPQIEPLATETPQSRKIRGAFFTPEPIARFITEWAVRSMNDSVLEPSCGDAEFLVHAVERLRQLGAPSPPTVRGVEIHATSAARARQRVLNAGGTPQILDSDFFAVNPDPRYTVAIGNPPYIRYQDFAGESRTKSRAAALRAGVPLSGLASSWAAFTVHTALFLTHGGRMGLVLPAELLSVNYAAPVRQFLFDKFRRVDLITFGEQVFPHAEVDVVLLLADGFGQGPAGHATIHQAKHAGSLGHILPTQRWAPSDPAAKWTSSLLSAGALAGFARIENRDEFTNLESWGDTTLGMVTGNNGYFALSPRRVAELDIPTSDLVRLSPPGSAHLRGLHLSQQMLASLGRADKRTWLFRPAGDPSLSSQAYIDAGETAGVHEAYKCRVRTPWWRVPLIPPADLLFTCMNADTARITTNSARVHHLNSVHGIYLRDDYRDLGRDLLPLASLNSMTLLSAEMVGRSYGGGILKVEPREADRLVVPSPELVARASSSLTKIRKPVARKLQAGNLLGAASMVDEVILREHSLVTEADLTSLRHARYEFWSRRTSRAQNAS